MRTGSPPVNLHGVIMRGRVCVTADPLADPAAPRVSIRNVGFEVSATQPSWSRPFMGGGLNVAGGEVLVDNTTFRGLAANVGAGIALSSGSIFVRGSRFVGNRAVTGSWPCDAARSTLLRDGQARDEIRREADDAIGQATGWPPSPHRRCAGRGA